MEQARLDFLAGKHAPQRKVFSHTRFPDRVLLELECGHEGRGAPHFDHSKTKTWRCHKCGEEIVRERYSNEF